MPSHKGNSRRHAERTKPTIVAGSGFPKRTAAVPHEVNDTVAAVPMARVEWSGSRCGTTLATFDPYRRTG